MNRELAARIAGELGWNGAEPTSRPIGGGDIAAAWSLSSGRRRAFIKTLAIDQADILQAEADGLQGLADTRTVRTPVVLARGTDHDLAWLALEHLDLQPLTTGSQRHLGQSLAQLHRHTSDQFGWRRDNYIGLTAQINRPTADWSEFFLNQRLGRQLDWLSSRTGQEEWSACKDPLAQAWKKQFPDHQPPPSLIHGDLWQGNAAMLDDHQPVIYDPAVHYADRECDLAMTHLFGGFTVDFYNAYQAQWPLPAGHQQRLPWYQLYHLLNHAVLFGGGYVGRVREEIGLRVKV
jgi:protein-ribulosamine 3-kinase